MIITRIFLIFSILFISACSTKITQNISQFCQDTHWYSLGHAAGEKGEDISLLKALKSKCGDNLDKAEIRKFQKGYLLGISKFCTYEKGFKIGEVGDLKPEGCPYELSENFNNGYRNGRLKYQENTVAIQQMRDDAERTSIAKDPTADFRSQSRSR